MRNAWYTRLGHKHCNFSAGLVVAEAHEQSVTLRNVFDGRQVIREDVDLLIDWPGCRANDEFDPAQPPFEIVRIGDCVAPRNLEIAISEAFAAARDL